MKKNRTLLTGFLVFMTVALIAATFYISTLLSSPNSPTQIQKTKASAVTYSRTVTLPEFGSTEDPAPTEAATLPTEVISVPTLVPTKVPTASPSKVPTLLAQAPTLVPTAMPTLKPTLVPTIALPIEEPTEIIEEPTEPLTPTLSPLLAYKSTGGVTPTLAPLRNATITTKPTAKAYPTGSSELPQAGWIQTSSILFIVATSTILFSLLF